MKGKKKNIISVRYECTILINSMTNFGDDRIKLKIILNQSKNETVQKEMIC